MIVLYALFALASIGTLLSGVAAVAALFNQGHIKRLRSEVNGRTDQLVATAHDLGVSEGIAVANGVQEHPLHHEGTP